MENCVTADTDIAGMGWNGAVCKYKVMYGPQPCDWGKYIHEKFGHWSFLWSGVGNGA